MLKEKERHVNKIMIVCTIGICMANLIVSHAEEGGFASKGRFIFEKEAVIFDAGDFKILADRCR